MFFYSITDPKQHLKDGTPYITNSLIDLTCGVIYTEVSYGDVGLLMGSINTLLAGFATSVIDNTTTQKSSKESTSKNIKDDIVKESTRKKARTSLPNENHDTILATTNGAAGTTTVVEEIQERRGRSRAAPTLGSIESFEDHDDDDLLSLGLPKFNIESSSDEEEVSILSEGASIA